MLVQKQKKRSKNAKSLKEKLDAKAKAKDVKAICRLVQEDVSIFSRVERILLIITSSLKWVGQQYITLHKKENGLQLTW
jgi:siroheme synthase